MSGYGGRAQAFPLTVLAEAEASEPDENGDATALCHLSLAGVRILTLDIGDWDVLCEGRDLGPVVASALAELLQPISSPRV